MRDLFCSDTYFSIRMSGHFSPRHLTFTVYIVHSNTAIKVDIKLTLTDAFFTTWVYLQKMRQPVSKSFPEIDFTVCSYWYKKAKNEFSEGVNA